MYTDHVVCSNLRQKRSTGDETGQTDSHMSSVISDVDLHIMKRGKRRGVGKEEEMGGEEKT